MLVGDLGQPSCLVVLWRLLGQSSLNNVHKGGLKQHHFISHQGQLNVITLIICE